MNKPKCKLVGTDGNVFALMGRVSTTLKENGMSDKAKEMTNKIMTEAKSYSEALAIMSEYVEVY